MALFGKSSTAVLDPSIAVGAGPAEYSRNKPDRFGFLARFIKGDKTGKVSLIERNLVTAGLLLKPTEFMMINIVVAAVVILLGVKWLSTWSPDWSVIGMFKKGVMFYFIFWIGWKGPKAVLQMMANKRRTTLEYQLMDALSIISSGLKGGYSFPQGVEMAAEQMPDPLKAEFSRVLRLIGLGMEQPRALELMGERVNSYDYDMTISAVNIAYSVGGALTQVLEGVALTIRERIRLRRDIGALTAQGRISGGILVALPVGIAIMLKFINPEYMAFLLDYQLGNNLLFGAALQQACGIYWISKLLDFDS